MTDTIHSCTNPGATRTKNHRKTMAQTWKTKQWKEEVKKFVEGKTCEWCGSTEKLLAHHPYQDTKDGIYSNLYLSGCIVVCSKCHFMYHRRHKKICPLCKTGWRHLDTEMCYACYLKANPEIVSARKVVIQARKDTIKRMRNADKERQKKAYELWKEKQSCKSMSYKEWKAAKIADGTWKP